MSNVYPYTIGIIKSKKVICTNLRVVVTLFQQMGQGRSLKISFLSCMVDIWKFALSLFGGWGSMCKYFYILRTDGKGIDIHYLQKLIFSKSYSNCVILPSKYNYWRCINNGTTFHFSKKHYGEENHAGFLSDTHPSCRLFGLWCHNQGTIPAIINL